MGYAGNYLINHWLRHRIFPDMILVSLREYLTQGERPPSRMPNIQQDTRWQAAYTPEWKGLVPVAQAVTVEPLSETDNFRHFGYGQRVGPTDLAFMVKGNNLSLHRQAGLSVRFPPQFHGWGPEDVCFAAKLIARGAFVLPVLSTSVFHLAHSPRSGSREQQEQELVNNLSLYKDALEAPADADWREAI